MSGRSSDLWLVYALGGGWGHLTRAAALARVARGPVRILTNSPYSGQVRERLAELDIVALDPELPAACARQEAVRHVQASQAACLIVDTFPRGLGGELAALLPKWGALRVLIHRDLNPDYVRGKTLDEFVRSNYDLVIRPGPAEAAPLAGLPQVRTTAPWLIRSGHELPSREAARSLLGVEARQCVLVCAAGNRDEQAWYGSLTQALSAALQGVAVRCTAPVCPPGCPVEAWRRYWPAMDLLSGIELVVGGAGYNTVNECVVCGVPLMARAWTRKYDRQFLRAAGQAEACPASIDDAVAAVKARLAGPGRTPTRREFPNGAREAAEILEALGA
ncbi:MAG: UDP-N-acetylglucosamine--LPS N-acetylglucosamine transferase [Bryobacteraceae bacterium]